jgi:hypothetical protein
MKRLAGYILAAVMLFSLSACAATPFVPPAECVNESSFILNQIPNPQALDRGLLVVQFTALQNVKGYSADDAHKVISDIRKSIEATGGITYARLVSLVLDKVQIANTLAGATLYLVGPDIEALTNPNLVSDCDLALIRLHLSRQDAMIDISAAGR